MEPAYIGDVGTSDGELGSKARWPSTLCSGLRKSHLGKGASLGGEEGRGSVGLACWLPFGTIQCQARGVFLDFKHEGDRYMGAHGVISVAESFSGLSALPILPSFLCFSTENETTLLLGWDSNPDTPLVGT